MLEKNGKVVQLPYGFSWKAFIFGPFLPLFRGDALWTFVYAVAIFANLMVEGFKYSVQNTGSYFDFQMIMYTSGLFFLFHVIFAFFYNKIYITNLIKKGYIPSDSFSKKLIEGLIRLS